MARNILVVEDDNNISNLIKMYLDKEGFDVRIAADGGKAVEEFDKQAPDMVLLDIMLPVMDGWELTRELRRCYPRLPIMLVTARDTIEDKRTGFTSGADDYLTKPFGTVELLARIRTAIRHTRTPLDNNEIAQSGKFTVKDLTIDYDKHHVLIGDQDVHLTLNEFKIVALLGKYAGKVLTYDYLIKQIWGPKAKADNQILRVNMANIRRKIEKNPASPEYIFTEIGVGYRMLENDA